MNSVGHQDPMFQRRRLSPFIIIGVITIPALFVWFLLRPGYSFHIKCGGFLLLGHSLVIAGVRLFA
jgi:hypothetical protein